MNFSMILVNNNYSKALLQNLVKNNLIPKEIIFLHNNKVCLPEQTENDLVISKDTNQISIKKIGKLDISFNEKEHIITTIKDNKIKFVALENLDINHTEIINVLKSIKENYIIYSGVQSMILENEVLSIGKKFLYTHPGSLPEFRGSSTIFYSILLESKICCSVILIDKGINDGPILYEEEFEICEKNIDFDYVLDPLLRAKTFINFFLSKKIKINNQNLKKNVNNFYFIHPFLKYLSIVNYNKKINNETH